ncbi:hypothetical protein K492DRAFT_211130 [Lichtheimia hyalospora FSU 10163]|nr:hypothetical protein K492DRAFT_211130 [Lichtheimia hyalospora FSU 10163]
MKVTSFPYPSSPPPSPCCSSYHANIYQLPFELWLFILSFVSPTDLHHVRQLCRMFHWVCDHPQLWKHLTLDHKQSCWRMDQIKAIVTPYTTHFIQSIYIEHASDAIVRFLIHACPLLQDLTLSDWRTLSHHALKCHHPMLRRFRLLGRVKENHLNFAAIGTNAIARFVTCCPQLQELHLVAKTPIHLPGLCRALANTGTTSALESMTLTTTSTTAVASDNIPSNAWEQQLVQACPKLLQVKLIPIHDNGSPVIILLNK